MDISELARLIDPEAWVAREEDQKTFGSLWALKERRRISGQAARRILDAGYTVVKLPGVVES